MWIGLICKFLQQAELADKEMLFEELSKKEEDLIKGLWSFKLTHALAISVTQSAVNCMQMRWNQGRV